MRHKKRDIIHIPPFPGIQASPRPPPPLLQPNDVGRIVMDAYERGRLHERERERIPPRPRPRVFQSVRPVHMARTSSDDPRYPRGRDPDLDDRLTSMSLDDEYDTETHLENERHRREFNLRAQNGSLMSHDPFEEPVHARRSREVDDYPRQHEHHHFIEVASPSPRAGHRRLGGDNIRHHR